MLAFPAEGPQLVRALRESARHESPDRPNYVEMAQVVRALGSSQKDNRGLIDAVVHGPGLIPRQLESLEAVKALVPEDALAGRGLIGAQHLLTNTVPLVEACLEKGMAAEDIHLIGTPYNNNPLVLEYLAGLGIDIVGGHDNLGSNLFLKDQKLSELESFVHQVAKGRQPKKGWKVLDDGGLLQKVISGTERPLYPRLQGTVADLQRIFDPRTTEAIEQTTRGSTEVPSPVYPTVAVFRAQGKKMEGEYIGWALADSLVQELRQRDLPMSDTTVTIAGAGTIGLWAAELLRKTGLKVSILDVSPKVLEDARERGFWVTDDAREAVKRSDVILSCSGRNIWPGDVLAKFEGLMLSGSSMAAEFDVDAINAFRSTPLTVGNIGRPLNFHGDGHAILRPDEISITLGLLFAGIAQKRPASAGYVDVDRPMEDAAIAAWPHAQGVELRPLGLEEAKARRPDFVLPDGSATHAQWLSYLSSLRRPVYPPPNSVRGQTPVYYFEAEDGATRVVDTRTGISEAVPLPHVPSRMVPLDQDGHRQFLVAKGKDGAPKAWLADTSKVPMQLEDLGPLDRVIGHYVRDETPLSVPSPPIFQLGVAYATGDTIQVLRAGQNEFQSLKRGLPDSQDSLFLWPSRELLLEVGQRPPKVVAHHLGGSNLLSQLFANNVHLPSDLTEIDAIGRWASTAFYVVVGKNAGGETVLAPIGTGLPRNKVACTLPKGAVFRGVRPSGDGYWGSVVVDYTLEGEPAETSAYRQVKFDMLAQD
jgi:D-isomer specific 2-hydroxyacid dehydrogenase, NAD binding domain